MLYGVIFVYVMHMHTHTMNDRLKRHCRTFYNKMKKVSIPNFSPLSRDSVL